MVELDALLGRSPLLDLAWRAAAVAAGFLVSERPDHLAIQTKSTPTDVVTAMDQGAEARIIDGILAERPDDGILGEEGGERIGASGVRWVIDPLDGTVNYLYRLPEWGVSIAGEVEGEVVVGVIVTPALGEASVALRGQGAWAVRGDRAERLRASDCSDLAQALVGTGFSYRREERVRQGGVVRNLLAEIRDIRRTGSAVIDLTAVARGRLDAFFESGLNRWDMAAGALIAEEAGASVTNLHGGSPFDGLLVAAAPGIAEPLRAVLQRLDA